MIDEIKRRLDRADGGDAGRLAALDHDHLEPKRARGRDLAVGGAAAGILGDDDIDPLFQKQFALACLTEGTAGEYVAAIRHGERWIDRIDAADEIIVPRSRREATGFLASDCEKDAPWSAAERGDSRVDILHANPVVTRHRTPVRSQQGKDRNPGLLGSGGSIDGDLVGEGMGRINKQIDAFLSQIINQAFDTPESSNSSGQGQGLGINGSARKGNRSFDIVALCQPFGQAPRLGRAAQYQDMVLGHG